MLHKLAALPPKATIAAVASCGPPDLQKFTAGVEAARALGYHVNVPDRLEERKHRYLAGPDSVRWEEFANAYSSPAAALWVARGGYGSQRFLPQVKTLLTRGPKKWLIGFSDVTALGCAFLNAGTPWLHAPLFTTLAAEPKESRAHFQAIVQGKARGLTLAGKTMHGSGKATGKLVGGNLAVFASLLGTPYFPDVQNAILCFEDIGEQPYRLDRLFTQLKLAGVFEYAAGLVLGHFTDCEPKDQSYTAREVLSDLAAETGLPTLSDVAFGHQAPNFALPMGMMATIDLDAGLLKFDEEMVKR